ncbi:hypothetical protein MHC_03705 [Mycoplasma haemocanis str. Illinois]|uniref:Uncharacterized protein n=1 Tax=Mycoplasma haemocanis (strain Illinois) TaxID=1111676 RepID=H6N7H9_MYCHN|nr:hypothetical protein [Mycoplasma haemocanis]AEW45601.1 hypothetical protein MHC_03705 [Mycoplasma haemocanis str. Illinois]
MKTLLTALVGGGAVASAGVGYFTYQKFFSENISSRLRSEKFIPLNDSKEHDAYWETLKTQYNSQKANKGKIFTDGSKDIETRELKLECKKALAGNIKDDALYSKVKRWCVVPVSLSEHLNKLNFHSFSTEDKTDNADKSKWESKVTEYEKEGNREKRISGLDTLSTDKWKTIMNKCKEIGGKKNYEDEFETNFEKYKEWCSTEKKTN